MSALAPWPDVPRKPFGTSLLTDHRKSLFADIAKHVILYWTGPILKRMPSRLCDNEVYLEYSLNFFLFTQS